MKRRYLVDELIQEVRSICDENNTSSIDDTNDIIPALNRAQDVVVTKLTKKYNDPFIANKIITTNSNQSEYDIPEDAFEERLEKVEVKKGNLFFELKRIDFRDITPYDSTTHKSTPYYYSIIGNKIKLIPAPANQLELRLWYIKEPEPMVKSQGRITHINQAQNYIIVDSVGEDLTTEMDNLNSYVNIIDGQSGIIKASLQIHQLTPNKITFKTNPTRLTVLNKEIASAIPDTVELDDLVCVVYGSCVPRFKRAICGFIVQFAAAEILRKLGGSIEIGEKIKADFDKIIDSVDKGREINVRVRKYNKYWSTHFNKRFFLDYN